MQLFSFSATLLPVGYYKSLLSTETDNYAVYAKTAFREEQKLLLLGNDVSSKYTRRSAGEFERIASYVKKDDRCKKKGKLYGVFSVVSSYGRRTAGFMRKNFP